MQSTVEVLREYSFYADFAFNPSLLKSSCNDCMDCGDCCWKAAIFRLLSTFHLMLLLSTFHLMLQCSVMDAGRCSVCGEESFGTGSDHIRYPCCSCITLQACDVLTCSAASEYSSHLRLLGRDLPLHPPFDGISLAVC